MSESRDALIREGGFQAGYRKAIADLRMEAGRRLIAGAKATEYGSLDHAADWLESRLSSVSDIPQEDTNGT